MTGKKIFYPWGRWASSSVDVDQVACLLMSRCPRQVHFLSDASACLNGTVMDESDAFQIMALMV